MRWSAYACEVLVWYVIDVVEIFRACKILIWHYTLDSGKYKFVPNACLELAQVIFQIWRGCYEHQGVVSLDNLVEVGGEEYLVDIEVCSNKIRRVMAQSLEILYAVIAPHIPSYVVCMFHHNLCNGGSPASSTDDGYFPTVEHDCVRYGLRLLI